MHTVAQLDESAVTWDNFVEYLNDAVETLSRVWGAISHLHHVVDTDPWRTVYNEFLPQVTEFWTELGQNESILTHYQTLSQQPVFSTLTPTRQRIVTNALRDFQLSGALLQGEART
jgi:oligopeptidase A